MKAEFRISKGIHSVLKAAPLWVIQDSWNLSCIPNFHFKSSVVYIICCKSRWCQFLYHRCSICGIHWPNLSALGCQASFFWGGGGSHFLFQENLQLALCVELHPRIQTGQTQRKKKTAVKTMNYCAVTRQVPLRGLDEEAGSVSRIPRGPSCIFVHTFECKHLWTLVVVKQKLKFKLKHFHCLDRTVTGVISQYNINPLRLKTNTLRSLTLVRREKKENNLRHHPNAWKKSG